MYTGLVLGTGNVINVDPTNNVYTIKLSSEQLYYLFEDLKVGEAIAVEGQFGTVTKVGVNAGHFEVQISKDSNSVLLKLKDKVNLERSLLATSRVEGIYMTGNVEDQGTITSLVSKDGKTQFTVQVKVEMMKKIAVHANILVNGIALTVTKVDDKNHKFTFVAWKHTMEATSLSCKREGDCVNVESDILSKYVEKYNHGLYRRA